MTDYTVFDAQGAYVKSMDMPDEANALLNVAPDEHLVEGAHPPQTYLKDGVVRDIPPAPHPDHIFDIDSETWIDPRTEADWTAELYARRSAASIPRIDFVLRCTSFGIMTEPEGIEAASGGVPPSMQAIIDSMPAEEQFEAHVRWAAAAIIDRTNPLIISMAAAVQVDEWSLDDVFGVTWPEPLASWPAGQLHP